MKPDLSIGKASHPRTREPRPGSIELAVARGVEGSILFGRNLTRPAHALVATKILPAAVCLALAREARLVVFVVASPGEKRPHSGRGLSTTFKRVEYLRISAFFALAPFGT